MTAYQRQHQHALEYQHGRPKRFDKHSLTERQPFMNMKIQKQQCEMDVRRLKKNIKEEQQKVTGYQQQLETLHGPFTVYFNRKLASLKINRSDYHERALIG